MADALLNKMLAEREQLVCQHHHQPLHPFCFPETNQVNVVIVPSNFNKQAHV
jgi:hypothetical protein